MWDMKKIIMLSLCLGSLFVVVGCNRFVCNQDAKKEAEATKVAEAHTCCGCENHAVVDTVEHGDAVVVADAIVEKIAEAAE